MTSSFLAWHIAVLIVSPGVGPIIELDRLKACGVPFGELVKSMMMLKFTLGT